MFFLLLIKAIERKGRSHNIWKHFSTWTFNFLMPSNKLFICTFLNLAKQYECKMYSFRIVSINVTCPIYKIYAFECCCNLFIEIEIAVEMPDTTLKAWFGNLVFLNLHITQLILWILLYLIKDQIDFYGSISWIKIPFPQKGY